jgi:hypothetical protein
MKRERDRRNDQILSGDETGCQTACASCLVDFEVAISASATHAGHRLCSLASLNRALEWMGTSAVLPTSRVTVNGDGIARD